MRVTPSPNCLILIDYPILLAKVQIIYLYITTLHGTYLYRYQPSLTAPHNTTTHLSSYITTTITIIYYCHLLLSSYIIYQICAHTAESGQRRRWLLKKIIFCQRPTTGNNCSSTSENISFYLLTAASWEILLMYGL